MKDTPIIIGLLVVGIIFIILGTYWWFNLMMSDPFAILVVCMGFMFLVCASIFYKFGRNYGIASGQVIAGLIFVGVGIIKFLESY